MAQVCLQLEKHTPRLHLEDVSHDLGCGAPLRLDEAIEVLQPGLLQASDGGLEPCLVREWQPRGAHLPSRSRGANPFQVGLHRNEKETRSHAKSPKAT